MKKYFTGLNLVFFIELVVVFTAVLGFIPRESFLFLLALLLFFIIFATYEESLLLVVRSIPLFVALPITESFDSLNIWRVVVLVLFLRWFFDSRFFFFLDALFKIIKKAKDSVWGAVKFSYQNWRIEFLMFLLFFVSLLSLFKAEDVMLGIKRIIYFANAAMLFFVVRSLVQNIGFERVSKNVLLSGLVVVVVGFVQLLMAYLMPINNFVEFWALQFDRVMYGSAWAHIAIAQNTWFAYYNETIHLRMFSSFPDTHSFPLYLLMALVFVMPLLYKKFKDKKVAVLLFIFVALSLFAVILTGTRGIWASFIFPVALLFFFYWRKFLSKDMLKKAALPFIVFLILLPLSAPVFASKQFKLEGQGAEGTKVFTERLKSIVDTEEVSNKGRIYIWTESMKSVAREPLLGVGINNFPTVLKEKLSTSKAGSSAHNIYLHIAAEMGLIGLVVFSWLVFEMLRKAWEIFRKNEDEFTQFFALNALLFLVWILGYLLTDAAIFDGRAFLMLMVLLGVLFSFQSKTNNLDKQTNG